MKATEFKIGDCVAYKGKPARIQALDSQLIYVAADAGGDILGALEDDGDISPIVLTEEILQKNWWRIGKTRLCKPCYRNERVYLSKLNEKYWQFGHGDHHLVIIEFIHELQHLLWTLGMDDNLKI